ncbi:hypothetical protein FB45DRAFT_404187 [Roridomyces roridus]|uniref:Pentatricopeptide repeat protein n=1 Tax=Roridomyces roridus TaxID=1738132 RepID=A0AAD7FUR0_9AGAR|nr:hypothetical protein FB45DRAFT_404187 [Roridomyces roridus]
MLRAPPLLRTLPRPRLARLQSKWSQVPSPQDSGQTTSASSFVLPDPALDRSRVPRYFARQQTRAYPVGKPWRRLPLPIIHSKVIKYGQPVLAESGTQPFYDDAFEDLDLGELFDVERSYEGYVDPVAWRRDLLRVLGNTQSHQQAWKAYDTLVNIPFSIPHRHLNRFVRLLSRETTKTRVIFPRLLAVLTLIHRSRWKIEGYQWNALIDSAGKGLRKARPQDFKRAFETFTDMVSSKAPGSALSDLSSRMHTEIVDNPLPDIITYTTLINHAVETRLQTQVDQSMSLLDASRVPPNRITHLVMLKHHSNAGNLDGVRTSLFKMRQLRMPLGLDGLNAVMWAYSRSYRLDVVVHIYSVLRYNATTEGDINATLQVLLAEGIQIPPDMVANETTYVLVIQAMAYHGNLKSALGAFMDMLSSNNVEIGAPMYRDDGGQLRPSPYSPTLPIFRGIFLGFSRHGVAYLPPSSTGYAQQPWVLSSLTSLFEVFLALPEYIRPSTSTIYWALIAFDKTSDGDRELLQTVWNRMEARFGGPWVGPEHRLQRIKQSLFSLRSRRREKSPFG